MCACVFYLLISKKAKIVEQNSKCTTTNAGHSEVSRQTDSEPVWLTMEGG